MNGSILQKYTARTGAEIEDTGNSGPGEIDDFGCFGWLRGIRDRSLALELRKANGNIVAVPYHSIERFEFDPSDGITLAVGGKKITLKGRHLNAELRPTIRLFEGLTRHRVSWVREVDDRHGDNKRDGETVIDTVSW